MQFNVFLNNLQDEEKSLYRKYEKTYFKIIDATKAMAFNENCIREELCPNRLNFSSSTTANLICINAMNALKCMQILQSTNIIKNMAILKLKFHSK